MVDISVHILFTEVAAFRNNYVTWELICPPNFNSLPIIFDETTNGIWTAKLPLQQRSDYDEIFRNQEPPIFLIKLRSPPVGLDADTTPTRGPRVGSSEFKLDLNLPYIERPQWMWLDVKNGQGAFIGRMYIQTCVKFRQQRIESSTVANSSTSGVKIEITSVDETELREEQTLYDGSRNSPIPENIVSTVAVAKSDVAALPFCTPCSSPSPARKKVTEVPRKPVISKPILVAKRFDPILSSTLINDTTNPSTSGIPQKPKITRKKRRSSQLSKQNRSFFNISIDSPFFSAPTHAKNSPGGASSDALNDPEVSRQNETFDSSFVSPNKSFSSISCASPSYNTTHGNVKSPEYDPWGRFVTPKPKVSVSARRKRRSCTSTKKN